MFFKENSKVYLQGFTMQKSIEKSQNSFANSYAQIFVTKNGQTNVIQNSHFAFKLNGKMQLLPHTEATH